MKRILSLMLALALSLSLLASCSGGDEKMGTGACEYLETRSTEGRDIKYVEMSVKGYGKMVILLDATTAPVTVANFIKLAEDGFYDGLTFHRVMEDFMIQGGDPEANGQGGSDEEIVGEFSSNGHDNDISHLYGVISMARSNDPNSASSQFFICNADATGLDGQYAAFGYVVEGLSVVDAITEGTMPYTEYYEYYGTVDYEYLKYYGYISGMINDKDKQAVINYVKVLDSWEK